jgi:hypothetical protein
MSTSAMKNDTTTLSKKNIEFIEEYATKYIEDNYEETDDEQLLDMKNTIVAAMKVMGEHVLKVHGSSSGSDLSEILSEVKVLTSQLNQQPPTKSVKASLLETANAASGAGKGTHNVSAFSMWSKQWHADHPKQKLPAGEWEKQCKADPKLKIQYQKMADKFNQDEGRVSTKGSTRAATGKVAGYTLMQKRMKELNLLLPKGVAKMSCNDQEFKDCQVLDARQKVDGPLSIAALEKWFQEQYDIKL